MHQLEEISTQAPTTKDKNILFTVSILQMNVFWSWFWKQHDKVLNNKHIKRLIFAP